MKKMRTYIDHSDSESVYSRMLWVGLFLVVISIKSISQTAYVTNVTEGSISVINVANDSVTNVIQVGNNTNGIAVSPDGKRVYAASYYANNIKIISTVSNTILNSVN